MTPRPKPEPELLKAAQAAISVAAPTLRELASDGGWSYSTIKSYSAGSRSPSPEAARDLAAGLRRRAARLAALADELERAAG